MRLERTDQLPVAPLRTQGGVHLEKGRRGHPHHLAGHARVARVGALGNEYDIDVADVVQFARTALAHRDDRQARWRVLAAHARLGHAQRRRQSGVRGVRQACGHHGEWQHRFVLDRRGQVESGQH
ncbi:Uncharacterised protein [Mycobacterium tuberculosis]|nr:Uncharacterised protein [Mycobacterium tuberculosis]